VDQLVLDFARKGYEDLPVVHKFGWDRCPGPSWPPWPAGPPLSARSPGPRRTSHPAR